MQNRTLLRPRIDAKTPRKGNAGASQPYTPTEDRGSERGEVVLSRPNFANPANPILNVLKRPIFFTFLAVFVFSFFGCANAVVTVNQGDDRPPLNPSGPTTIERPPSSPAAPVDYGMVDQKPQIKGGLDGFERSIHYPQTAKDAGIEGTVRVHFIVNTAGVVERAAVVQGIGGGCDEEALRAVQTARFEPGRQDGNVVNVKACLALRFQLPEASIRATFCAP